MQGLGSADGSETLAALSPAVLASNTWAMSKKGILDDAVADAAAAATTVQYYKQLQEVAQQQAAMNDKVKGTFALRAYKGVLWEGCVEDGGLHIMGASWRPQTACIDNAA